ncbi:MAG: hypothetical protein GX823_06465, partial [Clostridiales bacterium]|nr:hypothetical protein [Clostridiales bacterium]
FEMTAAAAQMYRADIRAAREKYAGQIEIFCGVEQDYQSLDGTDKYDYVLGATHIVTLPDGKPHNVDYIEAQSFDVVNKYFNGDFYSYAEAYYALNANIAAQTKCDVVAHFDLITKFNGGGRLFDESHPRYRAAAIDAMCEVLKTCNLFEVNTGAMYRVGNTNPYPAPFLLRELLSRGGEVILTSDSHDIPSLGYEFPKMKELLRSIGFKYRKIFTRAGFTDIKL